MPEGDEVINMCKGLEGFAEKRAAEKVAEALVSNVESLINNLGLTLEGACEAIGSSVQKYEEAKKLLNP